jgi:signal transduction histidine kinase
MPKDRRLTRGPFAVWVLTLTLALVTLLGLLALGPQRAPELNGPSVPWWALASAFGLAELFVIHVRIGRDAQSLSLSEIPLVIGLAYSTPATIVVAQIVGVGAALIFHRRQGAMRTAFNLAQRSTTTTIAIAVFATLHAQLGSSWPASWLAASCATVAADMVSGVLINLAIMISAGGARPFDQVVGWGTIFAVANTALALVAVMIMSEDPFGLILVAVPTVITFLAARAVSELQRKHDELERLQRLMRLAEGSLNLEQMLPALLDQVRAMFRGDIAELVLLPDQPGADHLISRAGPGKDGCVLFPETMAADRGVWARVASEREGVLLARPIRNNALAEYYESRGIIDAIVVPMVSDDEVMGMLTVANRLGDFSTFDEDDLQLLQVLANHVSVSVRNSRLVEELAAALEHERAIAQLKDDFVGTISHELRTPLTNVQGYVKTLLNPAVVLSPAEQEEFLSAADRQAERLKQLIEDLLFTSSIETSKPREAPRLVAMGDLIGRVVADRAGPGRIHRVALSVQPDLPVVSVQEENVARLIGNLVDNALKYSPGDASIRVDTQIEHAGIRVSVHDEGPGIPPDEQKRIFERFYQVDHGPTRRVGGVGMGLYICERAAEALGARVWLERSGPDGSTFCAWLPFDDRLDRGQPGDGPERVVAFLA